MQDLALDKATMWVQKRARTFAFWLPAVLVAASIGVLLAANPAHAATFTVNRIADTPDAKLSNAACDVNASASGNQCTLRAAIQEANNTSGTDIIRFNIPDNPNIPGREVKTISPASALPTVTEAVTMNGYSQPKASPNTLAEGNDAVLKIQLKGTDAGLVNGLMIRAPDSTVRGLVINRFEDNGILISGSRATGNKVQGNFIGTNADGSAALGNGDDGVDVRSGADDNTIGGTTAGARNVISGNQFDGVWISGSGVTGNEVKGNFIGTDENGNADLGNGDVGVEIGLGAGNTTIGGTAAGARNVISGNDFHGVMISAPDTTGNEVQGNRIGTDAAGNAALGNDRHGVVISAAATDNSVGGTAAGAGNLIAHNGGDGVVIAGSSGVATVGNSVLSNSIFSNGERGIDLGGGSENSFSVTANDTDDPDTGANNLQNFPVITSASRDSTTGLTTIEGTLNSNPSQTYTIQCFKADGDVSNHGEGQTFLGETTTATDANGDSPTFTCTSSALAVGDKVSATATNMSGTATNTRIGDTSEFSLNVEVTSGS